MSAQHILHVVVTKEGQVHVTPMEINKKYMTSGRSLFMFLNGILAFERWKYVDAIHLHTSMSVYRPGMQNVIGRLDELLGVMKTSPQSGVWTIYLHDDDDSGTRPTHAPARGTDHVNGDLHLSCFTVPEWRYIALEPQQRKQLARVNVDNFVKSWEAKQMPSGDRIWEYKKAIKMKTFVHQKEDMRTKVLDIPKGLVCMPPPDEAVTLLRKANVALDSLFANIKENENKFADYLRPFMNQERQSCAVDRKELGYSIFNYCSQEEYVRYGRVSSPKNLRAFLKSEPEFAVIDQFLSIYTKRMAQYFCGPGDATPGNITRIEEIINDKADLNIIKYEGQTGMAQHIDSILRSDATVFTVGVGRDVVYDMRRDVGRNPDENVSMIRSSNPEGTMIVLDDEARYMWTHGIPHSKEKNNAKYTFHLALFHTAGLSNIVGKCKEFDTHMYRSPAYTQHSPAPKTPSNPHIGAQHASLLNLLTQLQTTHMPDRIRRPGLPRVHPRPGWI